MTMTTTALGEDMLFEPYLRVFKAATIYTTAQQPDGRVIAGGLFSAYNGVTVQNLVRTLPDGSFDPSMLPQPNNGVLSIVLDNNKAYVGGTFTAIGSATRIGFGAFSVDTGLVDPLVNDINAGSTVTSMISDGQNMYMAGTFSQVRGLPFSRIARFPLATGVPDTTWSPPLGTSCGIPLTLIRKLDAVWAGCGGTSSQSPHGLVRVIVTPPGQIDAAAAPNPDGSVFALNDYDLTTAFAGGDFKSFGGINRPGLAKFHTTTGALIPAFNPPFSGGSITALTRNGDDLFAGGNLQFTDGSTSSVAILDAITGALKAKGTPSLNGSVQNLRFLPPDALGVTGTFDSAAGDFRRSAAIYKQLGNDFPAYPIAPGVSEDGVISTFSIFPDGSAVGGGDFTEINGTPIPHLAFFNPDASLNRSWTSGLPFPVRKVTGDSTYVYFGASGANAVGRLHRGTRALEFFNVPSANVESIMLDPNQPHLYVGDDRPGWYRINTATKAIDPTWNPTLNGRVFGMFDDGDAVLPFGSFTVLGGQSQAGVARVSKATAAPVQTFNLHLTLNGNTNGVQVLAAAREGTNLYLGGNFNGVNGQQQIAVALVNSTTGLLNTMFQAQASGIPRAMAVFGNKVALAFPFATTLGSHTVNGLASVNKLNGAFLDNYNATYWNSPAAISMLLATAASTPEAKSAGSSSLASAATTPVLYIGGLFDTIAGQPRTGLAALGTQSTQTVTVTEFYDAARDHYFRTANAEEAASLIANPAQGFVPTHKDFTAWHRAYHPGDAVPFDRFFGSVTPGPNSHFYTGTRAESSALKSLQYIQPSILPRWNFEETAFSTYLPDASGNCPAAAPLPVYRAYNNRALQGDSNHRFTTDIAAYNATISHAAWTGEGKVACAIQ